MKDLIYARKVGTLKVSAVLEASRKILFAGLQGKVGDLKVSAVLEASRKVLFADLQGNSPGLGQRTTPHHSNMATVAR